MRAITYAPETVAQAEEPRSASDRTRTGDLRRDRPRRRSRHQTTRRNASRSRTLVAPAPAQPLLITVAGTARTFGPLLGHDISRSRYPSKSARTWLSADN